MSEIDIDQCSLWCGNALAQLINKYNLKEIVELGTFKGQLLFNLSSLINGVHITCVDAWDETYTFADKMQYHTFTYKDFIEQLTINGYKRIGLFDWTNKKNTITLQRNDVRNAHKLHDKVDLVYIDATHTHKECKHDILSWIGKLNNPGFLCGHDHCTQFPGVKQAVDEVFGPITETTEQTLLTDIETNKLLLIHLYTMWIKKIW